MAHDNKQHLDPWHKKLFGWVNPTVISSNQTGKPIPAVETNKSVFRINLGDPTEYYLIENRENIGFDQNLPGWGLLIWHIDEEMGTNNLEWYPPDRMDYGHYMVALEQADGLYQLEKGWRGDSGDPFKNGASFTPITNPSSCDYEGRN
jgi:immune inhibitor A